MIHGILIKKMRLYSHAITTKLFAIIFILVGFFIAHEIALAAVAHDATSESHTTGTTGSQNQASFSWTHTPAGTPRGVLVHVFTISATKLVTGVTYGGVAMTEITGGAAADTAGEPGRVDTFFLGSSIPTGAQTITVTRTNNATSMYAVASTQTASNNTEIYTPGIVLLQESGTYAEQSVTDGNTGVNSVRYAAGYYGANNVLVAGANTTLLNNIDFGSYTANEGRETTAGQGARNVGFTGSSDDRAAVHLAIREAPAIPTVTSPTVTSITSTGATLGANVTSLGVPASISARGTCWGTSPAPTTNCVAEGGTTTGIFTHARTGMSPGVLYYYRGYATNSTGTGYSSDGTFTTTAPSGTVSASPSTCTILSGASTCTIPFTWSISNATSPNLYNATTATTYSSSASGSGVSFSITNGSNTVQARDSSTVLASTSVTGSCTSGTSWNGSICATNPAVPTVTSPTATSITTTGATLGANITSLGVPASISARGTCWGTSPAPTTNCVAEGGTTTGVFTHARTGMSPNTLYYYRGYATNSTGTGYSSDGTFTTTAPLTTIGDGTTPGSATVAPESGIIDLDYFTLQTNTGTDAATAVSVTLSPAGSFNNLAQVDITDNSNNPLCTAITNPTNLIVSFSTCNIPVTTSGTTYKVRITPKTHANMPAVPGASYATTGIITAFTSTNSPAGADTTSATITIDNLSPADVTGASGSAGNAQTTIDWTNPGDADYASTLVLRRASSAVVDSPTEGATYTTGNTIGTATVACVVTSPTATCSDTSLTNGTAYHYKIFTKDTNGNYSTPGVVPTGSPFTPSVTTFAITASSGTNGTVTPTGITNVAQGSDQTYTITPNSGYNIETLIVDSVSVATSTSYTFTNVQAAHTISATFIAIPVVTYTITASSGTNGSITPSGATTVNQGSSQAYTITPDAGYNIDTLIVDSVSVATSTSYTFTNVQANHTISATFVAIITPPGTFLISATAGTGGTVVPTGSTSVTQGANQTYTITPDAGYNIETLTVDSVSIATSTSYTFTNVQAAHTISATFVAIPAPPGSFNITASSGTNGSVIPSGITTVTQGNSQAYTITPDSGYYIASLSIDGSSVATSTSYTFTNVQAAHTISATFSPITTTTSSSSSSGGVSRPTTITFFGDAFTGGTVSIINKFLSTEKTAKLTVSPEEDGSFRISFIGILQGLQDFGLLAKDKSGRSSQTKFFFFDTTSQDFVEKEIIIPPTIDVLAGQITRGKNVTVYGYASPNHSVNVYIDGILSKEGLAENDGTFSLEIQTGTLNFGQHSITAKQINPTTKAESDYSTTRSFIVSQLTVVKADFSGDGKIDIKDWSIFLSRWGSKNPSERLSIDLTGDGKVDISDFSIFIKTIKQK